MHQMPQPNPVTTKPKFAMPEKACDTQVHLFHGVEEAGEASSGALGDESVPGQRAYLPPHAPLEAMLNMHRAAGIERGVFVHPLLYGGDHSIMLDALARAPGTYRGVATVDDTTSDASLETFHRAGVRGARFHFRRLVGEIPDAAVFQRTIARIAELGWHAVLHVQGDEMEEYVPLFKSLTVPFVIDHMGHIHFSDGLDQHPFKLMLDLMREDNCWVKIANADRLSEVGPPGYSDAVPFIRAIVEAAPERVIWATDWPQVFYKTPFDLTDELPDTGDLLNLLYDAVPDSVILRGILVDNPARLYGFDD